MEAGQDCVALGFRAAIGASRPGSYQVTTLPPSAKKVDAFLFKSLGGLMEQLNDCLQLGCL